MQPTWWAVAVLVTLAFSGCLGDDGTVETPSEPTGTPQVDARPPLPENISTTLEFVAGFDIPLPVGAEEFCWMPSNACQEVAFTVPDGGNVTISAAIGWGGAANNFGLFIYEGDAMVESHSGPTASNQQRDLTYTFERGGDFRLVVDAHWTVPDTVQLEATFAHG